FLAALSHELRTPLNPVLLLASEAAESETIPEELRESFTTIRNNVQLEARLIDDLLDLTRISRGKLSLERCETDAHAVLRETIAIVRADADDKNIELSLDLTARETTLQADPVRLQQIFWNVLKNAVKFTPEGGRVSVHTDDAATGDRLLIRVTDNGIGMTGAEIARIFDAFAQGDHAEQTGGSHRFGGLGLGLAISQMLAELHGGSIRASSAGRGEGSTFEIDLPTMRAESASTQAPTEIRSEGLSAANLDRLQHERFLVVEDHEATCRALAALLRRRGFAVSTAKSVAEAKEIAAGGKHTLLLSDIGLPDGSGFDLMRELHERYGMRGIALTGYGRDEDVARSRSAGFTAHLTKPISAEALERTLAILVRASDAAAEPRSRN
ncbi:MAG TPA: ATP-binding protein, partial [Candidatus Synoicihabitans sp.]|nr:ATP-binding protein [Candidatus Synoicihabitans sp.]